MNPSSPPQEGRRVSVGLFEQEPRARQAVQAVAGLGIDPDQVGVLAPGAPGRPPAATGLLVAAPDDVRSALVDLGVPEGEARFYALEAQAGRTLVVVQADEAAYAAAREVLLSHGGYDVQSRGAALARAEGAGVPGGSAPRPPDVTGVWEDVRSRYQMLWQQHYGTSDAEWTQVEPVYRYAWQSANRAEYRGRPWAEIEPLLRAEWQRANPARDWAEVQGPIRDVWEDVAEEAALGAEGGQERRIPRQGTDQAGRARDLVPPSQRVP